MVSCFSLLMPVLGASSRREPTAKFQKISEVQYHWYHFILFNIVPIHAFEVPKRPHVNASETCFAKADDVHPGADLVVFK